ncbi:hypothetical protein HY498_02990 [Candidatus Woesearchaeota archaeon]|nr:hypothetical protein [Candidatus Woesearchaeota archaeon]
MLLKKGDGGPNVMLGIVLVIIFAVVAGSIVYLGQKQFSLYGGELACAISGRINGNLVSFFGKFLPATMPLACGSKDQIAKGDKDEVIKDIVKLMGRCWEMLGNTPHPKLLKEWFFAVNSYNTCFNFNIDLDKSDEISVTEFLNALNIPLNKLFNDDSYTEESFVEYVERTGLWGNKLRIDNRFLGKSIFDKDAEECKKISCRYYIRFYDGFEMDDPDRLIFTDDYAYDGGKDYISQRNLLAFGGVKSA